MPRSVHADTRAYTTQWDDELDAVVHKWNQYVNGEMFRDGCEAMIELIEERNASKILIDHRDMQVVDKEDQEYIVEEWVPSAVEAGAEYHMVVHQESTIAEMNLDNVIDLNDVDYESNMTSDVDEAREWISSR